VSDVTDSIRGILQAIHALRETRPRIWYSPLVTANQILVAEPDALFTNTMKVIIVNPAHRSLVARYLPEIEEFTPSAPQDGKVLR